MPGLWLLTYCVRMLISSGSLRGPPSMTPEHQPLKSNPEGAPDHVTMATYSKPSPSKPGLPTSKPGTAPPPSWGAISKPGLPTSQPGAPSPSRGPPSQSQGPLPPSQGPPSWGPISKSGTPNSKQGPPQAGSPSPSRGPPPPSWAPQLCSPPPLSRVWPTHLTESAAIH